MSINNKFINVLIVDDEQDICEMVSGILADNGYSVRSTECYVDAVESIEDQVPQLVILDVWLGDSERDGMRLLQYIKNKYPHMIVIMMSGHGTIATAVEAIKRGAYDFLEKPFDSSRLIISIEKALEVYKLQSENNDLKIKAKVTDSIIGISTNIREVNKLINQIAPLNGRCTILGPKGSDKESIARKLHERSHRAKASFYVINCLQCNTKQLEIELYGSEIIVQNNTQISRGLFERSSGGTLFLDNIDSISPSLQNKLLSTLIDNKFKRVGARPENTIVLNSRIIIGVPNNIEDIIKQNLFNKELLYRLSPNKINILPLNERVQDIPYLLQYYLDQAVKVNHLIPITISSEVIEMLKAYTWPGDMMELKNIVDWILSRILSKGLKSTTVYMDDLPIDIFKSIPENTKSVPFMATVSHLGIKEAKESFEREYFRNQLQKFSGNVSRVSKFTGMERSALYRKLRQLNIKGE